MKLPTLPKLSMVKLSRPKPPQPKRLQATARRAAQPMDDFDDEPTTRLSSAFIVVLILHLVAVGGIYAFNSIKSQRRSKEISAETASPAALSDASAGAVIPASTTAAPEVAAPSAPTAPSVQSNLISPVSGGRVHKVQSGETLSQLAVLYAIPVADLAQANGLENTAKLQVGRALNIPSARTTPRAATADVKKAASPKAAATPEKARTTSAPKTYTVVKGDNPVSIARRFGVSYEALLKLNKITDPRRLQLGQELQLPPKKSN